MAFQGSVLSTTVVSNRDVPGEVSLAEFVFTPRTVFLLYFLTEVGVYPWNLRMEFQGSVLSSALRRSVTEMFLVKFTRPFKTA